MGSHSAKFISSNNLLTSLDSISAEHIMIQYFGPIAYLAYLDLVLAYTAYAVC